MDEGLTLLLYIISSKYCC